MADLEASAAYRAAGVDLVEAQAALRRLASPVKSTHTPRVLAKPGAFAGFFAYPDPSSERLLVSSMDGVGTKMRIAALAGRFRDPGYDIASHCVNDILVHGATPLFFLDYIGAAKLSAERVGELVDGMAEACRESGCALIGGETAEMPGIYAPGDWEVVGTIVGEVTRSGLIDGATIRPGDRILGLRSWGLHTNGYSLARRALKIDERPEVLEERCPGSDRTWADLLLARHRMYLPFVRPFLGTGKLQGMIHLTGGGIPENVPRILPPGTCAVFDRQSWEIPPVFRELCRLGPVGEEERYRVFNMGIGYLLVVRPDDREEIRSALTALGETPIEIGWIEDGTGGTRWRGSGDRPPAV
ncbi:MAG: phosphoribosylformylglycinamidine cyclo-ligase [Candidatus Eisenbacteria bacterium]|nr:phosphoribosylformylglycinamidine cyclo-ligase [Candidatus Eisenbacteria bacterium]